MVFLSFPLNNYKQMKELFKEGDTVFHKNNLDQELIVDNIYKEKKTIVDKFNQKESKFDKKEITVIRGIGVHWWNASKEFKTFRFHSNELVPKSIAEKGIEEVEKYLNIK